MTTSPSTGAIPPRRLINHEPRSHRIGLGPGRYTPQHVLATLYHVLGIDPAGTTLQDHSGRPQYLLDHPERITALG